jgi:osmotically-inducible protein OsmY
MRGVHAHNFIMNRFFSFFPVVLIGALALSGCTPVGVAAGAGATLGISASQEGGLERATTDAVIQAKINELWLNRDFEIFQKLDLTVNNGRVLITGVVQNPEHRVEAVRLAWQPKGVKQVINEIQVADSDGIPGFIRDNWISARLRTAITLDRDVQSLNYNIDTVKGIIYLMGYAQNQAELNRVMEAARTIPNVKQVVSYVKVLDKTGGADDSALWAEDTGVNASGVSSGSVAGDPVPVTPVPVDPAPVEAVPLDNSAYEDFRQQEGY